MFSRDQLAQLLSKLDKAVRDQVGELLDTGTVYEAERLLAQHLGSGELASEVVASMIRLTGGAR